MSNNHTPKVPSPFQLDWMTRLAIDTELGLVYNTKGKRPSNPVGNSYKDGHYRISVLNVGHPEHRLFHRSHIIWWAATGVWPTQMLDHRDRNSSNDAFLNLRYATESLQAVNKQVSVDRILPAGVRIEPNCPGKPYQAYFRGRHIGYYATIEEAVQARFTLGGFNE